MGFHSGEILYKHGFRLPQGSRTAVEFGRRSERDVRRLFPQILDEIQGFSEGCRASYEASLGFMLTIGIKEKSAKCSVLAATNGEHVIFGRNYDFFYKYKDYLESCLTAPDGGLASIGHSDVFIGKEDGINEKMLAVAMAFVNPARVKPGVNFPIVVRYVLDRCRSVEEAFESLKEVRYSTTNNYLLADPSGAMAVVEASPGRVEIRRPKRGEDFVACTNHFNSPKMLEMEDIGQRDPDSVRRYVAMVGRAKRMNGHFGMQSAKRVLSDDSDGVCSHRPEVGLGTLWSVVADLTEKRMSISEGQPCKKGYVEDSRLKSFTSRSDVLD
jgi:predicted choloylglycine hydrolase